MEGEYSVVLPELGDELGSSSMLPDTREESSGFFPLPEYLGMGYTYDTDKQSSPCSTSAAAVTYKPSIGLDYGEKHPQIQQRRRRRRPRGSWKHTATRSITAAVCGICAVAISQYHAVPQKLNDPKEDLANHTSPAPWMMPSIGGSEVIFISPPLTSS